MTLPICEIRAFPRHAKQLTFCMKQCRDFYKQRGLDWDQFVREGTPVMVLYETGDARAIHVADTAVREAQSDGRT